MKGVCVFFVCGWIGIQGQERHDVPPKVLKYMKGMLEILMDGI